MTRPYSLNQSCLDCGAPVGRRNARCEPCRKIAKSAWNKAYQYRYHALYRPAPTPRPQSDGALPPLGAMIYDDDGARVQCHACAKLYGSLVGHIRMHGLDADSYKERYELARTQSLLSPATAEKQRQAALARNQGDVGRENLLPPTSRPRGLANRRQSRVTSSTNSAKRKT